MTKVQKSSKKNHLMKSSWKSGKTATMRVPIALKENLMQIARYLDEGGEINLEDRKTSVSILSQEKRAEVINCLQKGITSKKDGGIYNSSNASVLKRQVIKALKILEN